MSKCFRKQDEGESTWKDKSVSRHKHQFDIECVLEIRIPSFSGRVDDYNIMDYSALMCSKCHTFTFAKSIVKDRVFAFTSSLEEQNKKVLSPELEKLPRILAFKKNYILNSLRFDKIIFFDNTEYNK